MHKKLAFAATLWSGADIFLRQALRFVVTIVLARLLTPNEFGTVAMLSLFVGIATVFADGGFAAALIQRQDVDHVDESTVFWLNLAIGGLATLLLCAAAPFIAAFYDMPALTSLMLVMAPTVLFGSAGAIHSTLLCKQLDFRTQLNAGLIATLVSGLTSILLAQRGFGPWALVAQALTMSGVTSALLWLFSPWRPLWVLSSHSARKLFGFGGYHLASSLLEMAYSRLYTMPVGKLYGPRELGYYNNADAMQQMPGTFLSGIVTRVAFPMFSAVAQDKVRLRRGLQLATRGIMLINVPAMLGMAALATPLIQALFGDIWLPAAPILRILCLAGCLLPLHILNVQALMAQGHSNLLFRLEVAKKSVGITLIFAGAFFGIKGIAWSQVAFSAFAFTLNTHYTQRLLKYGLIEQMRDIYPAFLTALPMAAGVYMCSVHWKLGPILGLLALVSVGILLFLGLAILCRLKALSDVILLFRPHRAAQHHPSSTL